MRTALLSLAAVASAAAAHGSNWDPKYAAMAQATLAKMTPAQKFTMVHGAGGNYVGNTPAITLSDGTVIPPLNLEDGPQGVADGVSRVTAWPSALTVVQTWDPELMYQYGAALGREQWLKGVRRGGRALCRAAAAGPRARAHHPPLCNPRRPCRPT